MLKRTDLPLDGLCFGGGRWLLALDVSFKEVMVGAHLCAARTSFIELWMQLLTANELRVFSTKQSRLVELLIYAVEEEFKRDPVESKIR